MYVRASGVRSPPARSAASCDVPRVAHLTERGWLVRQTARSDVHGIAGYGATRKRNGVELRTSLSTLTDGRPGTLRFGLRSFAIVLPSAVK